MIFFYHRCSNFSVNKKKIIFLLPRYKTQKDKITIQYKSDSKIKDSEPVARIFTYEISQPKQGAIKKSTDLN